MLFGDYLLDIKVVLFLIALVFIVSVFVYKFTKNLFFSIFLFSFVSNLIFFLDIGSVFYRVYDLNFFVIFTRDYWPYINLVLFCGILAQFFWKKHNLNLNH